jgi:hypothetical protein
MIKLREHRHSFDEMVSEHSLAIFVKQEGQNERSEVEACGEVKRCRCGTMMLYPCNESYQAVEVEVYGEQSTLAKVH